MRGPAPALSAGAGCSLGLQPGGFDQASREVARRVPEHRAAARLTDGLARPALSQQLADALERARRVATPGRLGDQLVVARDRTGQVPGAAVELVGEFNGWERLTLTRRIVNRARCRVVLVSGPAKRSMVDRWLSGDRTIPISGVRRSGTRVFLDPAAAPSWYDVRSFGR